MLLQQCRMASMGEMIDSTAHQWRQPLMSINAILMTMDRAIETNTKPPQYLEDKMEDIIALTTHMSQTIEDFRSLFKTDKEKTIFDLGETLIQVLDLFKSALKEVRVKFDNSHALHYYGHHNELKQVIIILLSNALEAFESRQIKDRRLIFMIKKDHERLSLVIEDNAGGIAKETLEHIFDPYFSTKKSTGGSGLGLYIAKIIIEQNMQGELTVINTVEGAHFSIILPCS
jgi:signal transduction histidine kinase